MKSLNIAKLALVLAITTNVVVSNEKNGKFKNCV